MTDTAFNAMFAEARANAGLTVADLAERTGFTRGFIRSYEEYAKNPTMQTMWRYAVALRWKVVISPSGVTVEDADGNVLLRDWSPSGRFDEE